MRKILGRGPIFVKVGEDFREGVMEVFRDWGSKCTDRYNSQFENNYFTEMCSGSEAGSYLRPIDFLYHSTLGLRAITEKKNAGKCPDRKRQGGNSSKPDRITKVTSGGAS